MHPNGEKLSSLNLGVWNVVIIILRSVLWCHSFDRLQLHKNFHVLKQTKICELHTQNQNWGFETTLILSLTDSE